MALRVVQGLVFSNRGPFLGLPASPCFPQACFPGSCSDWKGKVCKGDQPEVHLRSQALAPRWGKGWLTYSPTIRQADSSESLTPCTLHSESEETCQVAGFLQMKISIYINRYCLVLIKLLHIKDGGNATMCGNYSILRKMA